MSKYYRVLGKRETFKTGDISCYLGVLRPVEVDEWHPASKPPKPEDFEPTGSIDILYHSGVSEMATRGAWQVRKLLTLQPHKDEITHWRKITPPK